MSEKPVSQKFVPHKALREGWAYVTVADSDYVIGIKLVVTKVVRILKPDGSPDVTPQGEPIYGVTGQNVLRVLSKKEWEVLKTMEAEL